MGEMTNTTLNEHIQLVKTHWKKLVNYHRTLAQSFIALEDLLDGDQIRFAQLLGENGMSLSHTRKVLNIMAKALTDDQNAQLARGRAAQTKQNKEKTSENRRITAKNKLEAKTTKAREQLEKQLPIINTMKLRIQQLDNAAMKTIAELPPGQQARLGKIRKDMRHRHAEALRIMANELEENDAWLLVTNDAA
jgi:hypothetical protein